MDYIYLVGALYHINDVEHFEMFEIKTDYKKAVKEMNAYAKVIPNESGEWVVLKTPLDSEIDLMSEYVVKRKKGVQI